MEQILATVRRIIAEDELGAERSPGGLPVVGGEVLELTDMLQPDGRVRRIPPFGTGLRGPDEPQVAAMPDGRIEPAPPRPGAANPEAGPPEPRNGSAGPRGERGPRVLADPSPRAADRTLEELVGEMLRPMLQRWLDENLPELVQRAVRAEVARLGNKERLGPGR